VEEDGRLHDVRLRENFIERIFVMQRWRELLRDGRRMGNLVAFHTRHKLLMLAHSPKHYQEMGRIVARDTSPQGDRPRPMELFAHYEALLMQGLKLLATPAKSANVLQHMMGYFKKQLTADEKQELRELIDHYRLGLIPLIVPVTLIAHYVRKFNTSYLADQVYLNPHPLELQLRNHA